MNHKIALLTDSGTDVPKEYIEKYGIFVVPLMINYSYGEFRDGIDITPQAVYDRFHEEIPKTSLPSGESITQTLQAICDQGYTQVVAMTISSGLSGTNNIITQIAAEFPQLDCRIIDTKNIGIGSGMIVIRACELIAEGLSLDEVETRLSHVLEQTQLHFCISTLEYLKKGGRIGLVSATMGSLLGILPIISCNKEGIYYTVKKSRGKKAAHEDAIKLAAKFLENCKHYNLAIVHGGAPEDADIIAEKIKKVLPNYDKFITGQISPALVVHTGPGLIGICAQKI